MRQPPDVPNQLPTFLVRGRAPQGSILVGAGASPLIHWVARDLQSYLQRLTGATVPVRPAAEPGPGWRVVLGGPTINPLAARAESAGVVSFADLAEEGFLLKSVMWDGIPYLFIGGRDDRATMYAAYDFLERSGVSFQLTGDVIPVPQPDLAVNLDVRQAPAIKRRGLHLRHFVMPWMGLAEFQQMIDQMARLKLNYLEFYWYVGGPWLEYAYQGEPARIGDIYHRESGYTAWRMETFHFSRSDMVVGRDCLPRERPCAPEFQDCQTPADALRVGQHLLHEMIAYAHSREIEIWLGTGDCPSVPPNLGACCRPIGESMLGCPVIPPGDPAGADIWTAMLTSLAETYPEADGYWVWLAENYFDVDDPDTRAVLARYDHLRPRLPGKKEILALGYDTYIQPLDDAVLAAGDLGLIHYAATLAERFAARYPASKLGVSVLGRAYLFPALDAVLPPEVALQSMEACMCWNRTARVPMECFDAVRHRRTFLVPRLDDDAHEFAMQFNVGFYHHDRVLAGSDAFGVTGIAPQTGRTRGLEQNAKYIAAGCWDTALTPQRFYDWYVPAIFGPTSDAIRRAYALLEENEWKLSSLSLDPDRSPWSFEGFDNFCNYADSRDLGWLRLFQDQPDLPQGPPWREQDRLPVRWAYRGESFRAAIPRLDAALEQLRSAAASVPAGAAAELAYVTRKTEAYAVHLRALSAFMECLLAYDAGFRAKAAGDTFAMQQQFALSADRMQVAADLAEQAAAVTAAGADHPTDRHLLFRYNVRLLLPLRAFTAYLRNVVSAHAGRPEREAVDWRTIAP
ncbi:hypothetical protein HQ590_01740 [bacterium]|nr:hypothetical protein [bacterium]